MIYSILPGTTLRKEKYLLELPIEVMPVPPRVYIHFSQHKGTQAIPLVKPGDSVKIGTKIGEANTGICSSVHSSVSGKVLDIKPHPHPLLGEGLCCIIESDYSDTWEQKFIDSDYQSLSREELLLRIKQAGIVGLGGGGYPTDLKLLNAMEKKIEKLIINGCESEPNLSADYRIMMEYPVCVSEGAKIIQKILGATELFFALPHIYKQAAELLKKEGIKVKLIPDRYPQGAERILIKKIVRINLPSDKLPIDFGFMVQNVSTCYAIFQAVKYNKPLIERVITVSGNGIKEPKNLLAKIGTPISDIIQYCGGLIGDIKKIIFGGLMTGNAQFSFDTPVIKTTNGIVFQNDLIKEETIDCVHCGKCVDACPMTLLPQIIYQYIRRNDFSRAIDYGLKECIECGICSYVCPSFIPLVHYFKYARLRIADE
ncbi:MAG: electron transport complex subunit RsxC [candidate division WOR-3 bacterium]